jgi:hypothetical protein
VGAKIRKDPEFKMMPDLEQIDKINLQEMKNVEGDQWWDIHRLRSLRRLEDYIRQYFSSDKSVLNNSLLRG